MKVLFTQTCTALFFFCFAACVPTEQVQTNFLKEETSPQEGGIRFTKLTIDEDQVIGPYIERSGVQINWNASPQFSISPDGQNIAYHARFNGTDNIYIKKTQGGKATVQRTFRTDIGGINYSPDGENIVFDDNANGSRDIFMINANEGLATRQLTFTSEHEYGPTFSPDSKTIFYTKAEPVYQTNSYNGTQTLLKWNYYVWSVNTETSIVTQYSLGSTPVIMQNDQMLITRNNPKTNLGEIWLINLKNGQESQILSDAVKGFSSPHISPDGKKIVCVGSTPKVGNVRANLDLYTINLDGTGLTQLTYHGGDDVSPRWSPDGKSIYFISARGASQVFNIWKLEYNQ